jgi:hypothetical protein
MTHLATYLTDCLLPTEDRRIDIGAKWSPVFGRYSFWDMKAKDEVIRVGDRVNVSKMNIGYTVWSWPGLA